jgi:ADP-dependent NAD(P)H-hydrate dehydratase / NAD(P)H-hydrate epimerase
MLLIGGTVPDEGLHLILGEAIFDGTNLSVDGRSIPCFQGTAALVSAACVTAAFLKSAPPRVLLIGDDGRGSGSRQIYDYLTRHAAELSPGILVLHYMLPVMGLMKRVCESMDKLPQSPFLIADAAAMYAAKAAALAPRFDVFTPDLSELAFLADPDASHPAYVSRHLFESDILRAPEMVETAYRHGNAAKMLFIKGATDYIAREGRIIETISDPDVPSLEAIGGTGDTISGMLGALVAGGLSPLEAARVAARANRVAGLYAGAGPATKIKDIVAALPAVFRDHLDQWRHLKNPLPGRQERTDE